MRLWTFFSSSPATSPFEQLFSKLWLSSKEPPASNSLSLLEDSIFARSTDTFLSAQPRCPMTGISWQKDNKNKEITTPTGSQYVLECSTNAMERLVIRQQKDLTRNCQKSTLGLLLSFEVYCASQAPPHRLKCPRYVHKFPVPTTMHPWPLE